MTKAASHARKACDGRLIKYRRDGRQVGRNGPSQCRVTRQPWATGLLQPDISDVGHLSAHTTGLMMQQRSTVSKAESSVAGDKTRCAHAVEDIIGYS
jgi:hypothetical protein